MDDVSDYFKSGFLSLHKNKIGKSYQQKTLRDRMNTFNSIRRETRNTLMFQKRNIDGNMTPINTPEPSKIIKKALERNEQKRPNKRLEMLNKWKAEKEKRKQEEKKKAKPLFKVCHVPVSVGYPDLEKVNKEIKGKPISQFAPPNHKFHAPKNVKPISLNTLTSSTNAKSNKLSSNQKSNLSAKNLSRQNSVQLQNCSRVTRSRAINESVKSNTKEVISQKPVKVKLAGESNKKIASKKSSQNITHTSDNENNFSIQQNNTKQKLTVTSSQTYRKEDLEKPVSSASGTINTKATSKCSPPKKSKKNSNQILPNDVERYLNSATAEKKVGFNKVVRSQSTPEIKFNKKNPKNSKIKFGGISDITQNENEHQNDKDSGNSKNSLIKSPKSRKSLNYPHNIGCSKIVPCVGENDNQFEEQEISITKTDLCKTPIKSRKSTSLTGKKNAEWKMTKVGDRPIEPNKKQLEECQVIPQENLKTPVKSRKSVNSSKKSVGWHEIEIVDSDDEILSQDIYKTPKTNTRKYKKTPRKGEKPLLNDMEMGETLKETDKEKSSPTTPKNNKSENISTSPVYISPFVTISRGKTSARKEYQVRQSPGTVPDTPDFNKSITNSTSPKAGAKYFSRKLGNEIDRIQSLCEEWNTYRNENNVPDEAIDMIDVAIGQSNLLISKKFEQFKGLIEQCRNYEYLEKPVTCEDLHGFWDMIYMQVEDLNKRFKNLNDLKVNNWREVLPEKKPIVKRGRGRPKKTTASSSLRNMIKAAREKKKSDDSDTSQQVPTLLIPQSDDAKVFTGGYYAIKSPVKEHQSPIIRPSSARRSLRVSLLAHQVRKRISSPGLTMMKVSQAIKSGDGLTPSKSILKSDLTKSATRITKSVLFKDDLEEDIKEKIDSNFESLTYKEDKENDGSEMNLIIFSPQTPTRRSRRLAKTK